MQVEFYKALWGMESLSHAQALEKIELSNYDGIEAPLGLLGEVRELHQLKTIGMSFVESIDQFKRDLDIAVSMGVQRLTVHAGKEYWSFEQGAAFFGDALALTPDLPFPVGFETHRSRLLFEPQSTARYLKEFSALQITADFSHWTCVCESLLAGHEEALELAMLRTSHIHSRVGFEEGPQVPDPRVEPWLGYIPTFEAWWDRIRDLHNQPVLTCTPEFGPPHYLWTNPATGEPLADLFDVCTFMRDRLKARWA